MPKSIYERTEVRYIDMGTSTIEWCNYWRICDIDFNTAKDSPLHHDNRCTYHLCNKKRKK